MMILLLVLIFPVAVLWEVMKRANGKKPRKKDKWKLWTGALPHEE